MRHNARIARSGVQYYTYDELPKLGLNSVPREYRDLRVFGVYRSAQCLKDAMPLFKHVPVMVGHQHWATGKDDPLSVGINDEDVTMRMCEGEVSISAPLDLYDDKVIEDVKEISPGYTGKYHWQGGIATTGEEFQIVCDKILDVNHIALVPEARGGENMKILDGGKGMKRIRSGLLWFIKRKLQGVADSEATSAFASTLEDIKKNRARWTDEEMAEHTNTLVALSKDLPDSEEKEKLMRFISDIPLLKEEDDATVEEAVNTLQEFYSSLDKDAISDVMEKGSMEDPKDTKATPEEKKVGDEATTEEKKVEDEASTDENKVGDESTTEEKKVEDSLEQNPPAPENPATPQADACDQTSAMLSAITALNEKLDKVIEVVMGQAGTVGDASAETQVADEQKPEDKKEENKVGDEMPIFTQTMQTINKGASLDDTFAKMKERR